MTQESDPTPTGALVTFSQFLSTVEDGQLQADLTAALREINTALNNHVIEHGGKPKATLTVKLDFKLDGGVFEIVPKVVTKLPDAPRGGSMLWGTASGHFSAANPKQMRMFDGPRVVDGSTETKTISG